MYNIKIMVTTNQKSIINTYTKKQEEYKHNTKDSYQIIREQKKTKGAKNIYKNNPIHINNYLKCKWTKCCNQKT